MFRGIFTSYRANSAWLSIELDREAARKLGVPLSEIFNALQVNFGSLYVNDFNRFGRTWQVSVQADPGIPDAAGGPQAAPRPQRPMAGWSRSASDGPDRGDHGAES